MTREEAIEYGMMWLDINEDAKDTQTYQFYSMAIKALEQDSKTGYWIDDKCSVCGKGIEDLIDSREWYINEEPNFCPYCGIKIIKPQESEEKNDK